jgi:FkbM family methyltransferase
MHNTDHKNKTSSLISLSTHTAQRPHNPTMKKSIMLKRGTASSSTKKRGRLSAFIKLLVGLVACLLCMILGLHTILLSQNDGELWMNSLSAINGDAKPAGADAKMLPHASCPSVIAHRKDEDFYDPNKALEESPKRHTITTPPFWISLHIEWFDKMRWVSIMNNGNYYETGLTNIFKEILANTESPGLVIDIGMNIGWFTLWSRAHGHKVAAFEPNPVMHVRVCESLALNGWDSDDSVKIFPYGLGNVASTMNLTTGKNPGGSSFLEGRIPEKFRKTLPVKVVRLDTVAEQEGWLDSNGPQIHLLKLDVEGFENFAFIGGTKLLQSGKISNIIMENSSTEESHVVSLFNLIYQSGYEVKSLLSVNGDPYHNDPATITGVNDAISRIPSGEHGKGLDFMVKITNNVWWVKRELETAS